MKKLLEGFGNSWKSLLTKIKNFNARIINRVTKLKNNVLPPKDTGDKLIDDLKNTSKSYKDLNVIDPKDLKPKQNNSKIKEDSDENKDSEAKTSPETDNTSPTEKENIEREENESSVSNTSPDDSSTSPDDSNTSPDDSNTSPDDSKGNSD